MTIQLKVELNFEAAKRGLDPKVLIPKDQRKKFLGIMLAFLLRARNNRVMMGKGNNGVAFKAYTESYRKWKKKRGKGRNPGSRGDWLRLNGYMLDSQQIQNDDKEGVILFSPTKIDFDPESIGVVEQALYNDRKRPFIAATKKEIDAAFDFALKKIRELPAQSGFKYK